MFFLNYRIETFSKLLKLITFEIILVSFLREVDCEEMVFLRGAIQEAKTLIHLKVIHTAKKVSVNFNFFKRAEPWPIY